MTELIDAADITALHAALTDAVNAEGHDPDCVVRCIPPTNLECGREHHCSCMEDEDQE